uniref:Reverse transcriptase domain-containing protein n=1 Tax=Graphocephala atropunctata TaxID=36148 RepID=A0A1B6KQ37_9HEMI
MSNKIELLNAQLAELTPDIVILTEHGLTDSKTRNTRLNGYSLVDSYSRVDHIKGGVVIYVNKNMSTEALSLNAAKYSVELLCEIAAIKIHTKPRETYIVGIYRPDYNLEDALTCLGSFLDTIPVWKSRVILMGDININSLDKNSKKTKQLQEFLAIYNIVRLELPPTRITPHTKTSIDFVCSNLQPTQVIVDIINTGISDHTGQISYIKLSQTSNTSQFKEKRQLNKKNISAFKQMLAHQQWDEIYNTQSVNNAFEKFGKIIGKTLNSTCPITKSKPRKKLKHIPYTQTASLKNDFLTAQEKYLKTGRSADKEDANRKKKQYDLKLRAIRREEMAKLIESADNKSKAIWTIINGEKEEKEHQATTMQLDIDGKLIDEPKAIANQLNSYFVNIANHTLVSQPQNMRQNTPKEASNIPKLQLRPTCPAEVQHTIRMLKPKTSSGIDEISPKTIKTCEDELAEPLADIINKSFDQATFPSKLKVAKVYPKFKKGNRKNPSNYRPIALLSTFSKIIEKIVLSRLLDHLKSNNLLSNDQHGFTTGRSTTTALVTLIETIIDHLENGNTTSSIFLDYSKAFDCLNHNMLIKKNWR